MPFWRDDRAAGHGDSQVNSDLFVDDDSNERCVGPVLVTGNAAAPR
jgi:hypothetical protein